MEKETSLLNYQLLWKPRLRVFRELNNIVVITGIARNAVDDARQALQSAPDAKLRFQVPTVRDERFGVTRSRAKILDLLERAVTRDLFSQALVPAVALTEAYLADMLMLVLRAFPEKLGAKEMNADQAMILEAEDLDDLLDKVISKRIHSAFYDSPTKYFEYIERTLSISVPVSRRDAYSEVKATRDIYVHNGVLPQGSWTVV